VSTSYRTKSNVNVEARVEGDAVRTIEYAHVAVHDDGFVIATDYVADLDISTPREYAIVGPTDLELHVLFAINASSPVIVELITGATLTDNGTGVLHFRPNLWSTESARDDVYHTPTYTGGATVYKIRSGGTSGPNQNNSIGGETRNGEEIIVPSGENIIMKITATTDNTVLSLAAEYYEVHDGATNPAA